MSMHEEISVEYKWLRDFCTVHIYRFVGAIMGTPADVVKARIMNQPTDKSGRGEY